MFDLICIGTVVVDLYFKADTLTSEEGIFHLSTDYRKDATFFHKGIGGGAVNVAIGAKKNGLHVALAGVIGNNSFKNSVMRRLKELKIDYSLSEFQDKYNNVSLVLTTPKGERSIINYRSALKTKYENEAELAQLCNTKMVYMANLPNLDLQKRIAMLKQFKKKDILTVATLGLQDCQKPLNELTEFIKLASVFIINAMEFAELVKIPLKEIDFKQDIQKKYLPGTDDTILIVTHGEYGSYGYSKDTIYFQKAISAKKIIDVNGAGDAYTAGFITAYLHQKDIQKAMKTAALFASTILSHFGAN